MPRALLLSILQRFLPSVVEGVEGAGVENDAAPEQGDGGGGGG